MQKTNITIEIISSILESRKGQGIKVQVNDLKELHYQPWQVIVGVDKQSNLIQVIETDDYNRNNNAGKKSNINADILLENLKEFPEELLAPAVQQAA